MISEKSLGQIVALKLRSLAIVGIRRVVDFVENTHTGTTSSIFAKIVSDCWQSRILKVRFESARTVKHVGLK